ncbi:hypothetical protein J2Z18_004340 [Paenibacillus lactis]|uniref:Uncharacterized protein n=1 Tax=Paenibacillus lactis TaxID=228574 RepID=A0ABS4FG62_9BACL|nr:hypothetical protein [Paenibacillus lactis]GIO94029.1 hypothetical protein J31TS3_52560 [Paenibacillus lactis]
MLKQQSSKRGRPGRKLHVWTAPVPHSDEVVTMIKLSQGFLENELMPSFR